MLLSPMTCHRCERKRCRSNQKKPQEREGQTRRFAKGVAFATFARMLCVLCGFIYDLTTLQVLDCIHCNEADGHEIWRNVC